MPFTRILCQMPLLAAVREVLKVGIRKFICTHQVYRK